MPIVNSNNSHQKVALDRAIKLSRQGKFRQAVQILEPLSQHHSKSAAVFGALGGAYFELGNMAKAAEAFRRSVKLNPKSELASLGLFHSLWTQNKASEAFAEMRRFLSISESVEYTTLLRDLAKAGQLAPLLVPAGAA
jgi:predicted Zn-dependent protease